jgi:hypothetical protein
MPHFVRKVNASPLAEVVLITCQKAGYFEPILAESMHGCQGGGSDNGTLSAAKNRMGDGAFSPSHPGGLAIYMRLGHK